MRATYIIRYCTHCHTTIGCYLVGLEVFSRTCDRCDREFCEVMSPDETAGELCQNCNWCWEDAYGHA